MLAWPLAVAAAPVALAALALCCVDRRAAAADGAADAASASASDASDEGESGVAGVLYDADGNRYEFDYMCHNCGKMVAEADVAWAPVGGRRVPPWRATFEHAASGKTHYIQEVARRGVNSVSACAACAVLNNDELAFEIPRDASGRRVDASGRSKGGSGRSKGGSGRSKGGSGRSKGASGRSKGASGRSKRSVRGPPSLASMPLDAESDVGASAVHDVPLASSGVYDRVVPGSMVGGDDENDSHDSGRLHDVSLPASTVAASEMGDAAPSGHGLGALPAHFVFDGADECSIDYRDVSRNTAHELILASAPGAHIVRPSSQAGCLSMCYVDSETRQPTHILLWHVDGRGWISKGVRDHFPSLSALRDHVLMAYTFNEPDINFQLVDRRGAEALVREARYAGAYVVRPPSGGGELTVTLLRPDTTVRNVMLYHSPNGWSADGVDGGPFASVRELLEHFPEDWPVEFAAR